jgi:hypothetical protein
MKREKIYLVLKRKDLIAALKLVDLETRAIFDSVLRMTELVRVNRGAPPLECVVVESDWPEYEPTWAAIEARVDAEAAIEVDNKHYCNDGKWWQMIRTGGGSILIEIGQNSQTLEHECFANATAAYKKKNKWLTKYNMFCPD